MLLLESEGDPSIVAEGHGVEEKKECNVVCALSRSLLGANKGVISPVTFQGGQTCPPGH